ncbi:MAG: ACT domain-containing protein [Candidatus Omnitrophica bacterium]|nr:ACT domain-containing protein [Candidatus Omnitrophota bacterium]
MKLTQISVFLENKKGRLYDATRLLGENNVNIRALTIAESQDFGVLRIVVDNPEKGLEVLKNNKFMASFTDIVAVEVGDDPGGLAHVLKVFADTGINIEYMYAFVEKNTDKALMVFRFDNTDGAIKVLQQNKINVVGKKEIADL